MNRRLRLTSVAQIHRLMGLKAPEHPLVTLLEDHPGGGAVKSLDQALESDLYAVSMKNGTECRMHSGRRAYDFQEGSVLFLAPGQIFVPSPSPPSAEQADFSGWTLVFHPDLLRPSSLMERMEDFTFFDYRASEALHVSREEQTVLSHIVSSIKNEIRDNLDEHSQPLLCGHIEILLRYCRRFYGRQFLTRSQENGDVHRRFLEALSALLDHGDLGMREIPSVRTCAKEVGYSPGYLSDLLKKETGKTAQELLYFHLIERAKDRLRASDDSVAVVAASLGFEYPQHFSKLFKSKVGLSPRDYRLRA